MPTGMGPIQSQDGLGLMDQAKQQYPILQGYNLGYKYSPGARPYKLETWPADEEGSPDYPRPKEFPIKSLGIEVYDKNTKPIDILGDVVSHHLIKIDPTVKGYYDNFKQSLTTEQKKRLASQYQYAQANEKETRPYDQWAESSGIPAYFRGYPFQQWDSASSFYTPDQMDKLDEMMGYLSKNRAFAQTGMGKVAETALSPLFKLLDAGDKGMNNTADLLRQLDSKSSDAARQKIKKGK